MTHYERIVNELEALATAEGLQLPAPAAVIALHELDGYATDLHTGDLICTEAECYIYPTPSGRLWLHNTQKGATPDDPQFL